MDFLFSKKIMSSTVIPKPEVLGGGYKIIGKFLGIHDPNADPNTDPNAGDPFSFAIWYLNSRLKEIDEGSREPAYYIQTRRVYLLDWLRFNYSKHPLSVFCITSDLHDIGHVAFHRLENVHNMFYPQKNFEGVDYATETEFLGAEYQKIHVLVRHVLLNVFKQINKFIRTFNLYTDPDFCSMIESYMTIGPGRFDHTYTTNSFICAEFMCVTQSGVAETYIMTLSIPGLMTYYENRVDKHIMRKSDTGLLVSCNNTHGCGSTEFEELFKKVNMCKSLESHINAGWL